MKPERIAFKNWELCLGSGIGWGGRQGSSDLLGPASSSLSYLEPANSSLWVSVSPLFRGCPALQCQILAVQVYVDEGTVGTECGHIYIFHDRNTLNVTQHGARLTSAHISEWSSNSGRYMVYLRNLGPFLTQPKEALVICPPAGDLPQNGRSELTSWLPLESLNHT